MEVLFVFLPFLFVYYFLAFITWRNRVGVAVRRDGTHEWVDVPPGNSGCGPALELFVLIPAGLCLVGIIFLALMGV